MASTNEAQDSLPGWDDGPSDRGTFFADLAERIRSLKKMVRTIMESPQLGINFIKMNERSLHICAYDDGSFWKNWDLSSQLGYIVFLCDYDDNNCVLAFRSFKIRRVVRYVLGAKVCAFSDAFDQAFAIQAVLTKCYGWRLPQRMYSNSKSLFNVIIKESTTTERRLSIDLKAVTESYHRRKISDIAFIRS